MNTSSQAQQNSNQLNPLPTTMPPSGHQQFTIQKIRIDDIHGQGMATFELITDMGATILCEHINFNKDGTFHSLETIDSNIKHNLGGKLAAVFDISGKPNLMPITDFVPVNDIIRVASELVGELGITH